MINPISPSIPTIGQRENAVKAMVAQGLQQLAMQIYVELAKDYILCTKPAEPAGLQQLAKDSLFAAQAYSQGLGIAQFNQDSPHG
jgi:hypothetical protein